MFNCSASLNTCHLINVKLLLYRSSALVLFRTRLGNYRSSYPVNHYNAIESISCSWVQCTDVFLDNQRRKQPCRNQTFLMGSHMLYSLLWFIQRIPRAIRRVSTQATRTLDSFALFRVELWGSCRHDDFLVGGLQLQTDVGHDGDNLRLLEHVHGGVEAGAGLHLDLLAVLVFCNTQHDASDVHSLVALACGSGDGVLGLDVGDQLDSGQLGQDGVVLGGQAGDFVEQALGFGGQFFSEGQHFGISHCCNSNQLCRGLVGEWPNQ
ncbi:hypothetical protein PssvBMR16_gp14c [Pseudomonas phage MR16]|nr:hypothetical protein PssvBMR8_gp14c [Pseudomonas phage MR8]QJD55019.1 hypothetical protein PssvBMR12_gp14c [Pseudomonas phage MR12]QJF74583.1 hypothetical protein PssvBMR16_gp14c [Pseudomonas phage MR16]